MTFRTISPGMFAVLVVLAAQSAHAEAAPKADLVFACAADNDLHRVMTSGGENYPRFATPAEAVRAAPAGAGVLVLADGYPQKTTAIGPAVFDEAARKRLRLYVEFPAAIPGTELGLPRRTALERVVVTSDAFGPSLPRMKLLAIHDCHFVETKAERAHLVVAKVAGFDTAVYGVADVPTHPILFECPDRPVLVSTTKLSQFVTARYATKDAMQAVWRMVLAWLRPGTEPPKLEWTPTVRPTCRRDEPLPADAVRRAIARGIDWHTRAHMLLSEEGMKEYERVRRDGTVNAGDPVGPRPGGKWPAGDGRFGVMEGFSSRIGYDGFQPIRWWLRSDSNGESTLAFALRWKLDGDPRSRQVAANLEDWVYLRSGLFQNDPAKANYGLLFWAPDNSQALYQDNDIKAILGCIGTAGALGSDRWDDALVKNILGNWRTTGVYGFRGWRLENPDLLKRGWQSYWRARTVLYQPHYEAWTWAAYLWLYDKTRYEPLLERTRGAIRMMMRAYPDGWRWTNGIQQERGRMLLPLAWLVRVDDRPEHRAWLKRLADDIERCQDSCGAIREELGALERGDYRPPRSNAEYGTTEASLIQANGDPVSDLLYTCNFTFLGLHEAAAATGDPQYRRMADKLADFLVRIQVHSEAHPELDGGWFRAFDYRKWDYWGSNADAGWGAWSIEVGWTQAWVPTVLSLRELKTSLWDLSRASRAGERFEPLRRQMIGDEPMPSTAPKKVQHAAVDKQVRLAVAIDPRYPGAGAPALCDGLLGFADHTSPEWLGFEGKDLEATIDLGAEMDLAEMGADFLQSTKLGIFLPKQVELAVSADGREFEVVATVKPTTPPTEHGPLSVTLAAKGLKAKGRYVRVRATNFGTLPDWVRAGAVPAWLFVDEIVVNPK